MLKKIKKKNTLTIFVNIIIIIYIQYLIVQNMMINLSLNMSLLNIKKFYLFHNYKFIQKKNLMKNTYILATLLIFTYS
jgi:hypothetical protein